VAAPVLEQDVQWQSVPRPQQVSSGGTEEQRIRINLLRLRHTVTNPSNRGC